MQSSSGRHPLLKAEECCAEAALPLLEELEQSGTAGTRPAPAGSALPPSTPQSSLGSNRVLPWAKKGGHGQFCHAAASPWSFAGTRHAAAVSSSPSLLLAQESAMGGLRMRKVVSFGDL